jgi:protein arginine kinase
MVNEEDHLRLQVMRSGMALRDAWHEIDQLDDALELRLSYAFHDRFGYLTACPTNVGTGLRASLMLHLPALGITRELEKVLKSLQRLKLEVRGLYGEGSRASGDLYQISNQVTLGRSEQELLHDMAEIVQNIIQYERKMRHLLLAERKQAEQDRVARAIGTLTNATMMTGEEAMELLSTVRLGIHLSLLTDFPQTILNQLFIHSQAAHLQKLERRTLNGEERNTARANYLRSKLRDLGKSL